MLNSRCPCQHNVIHCSQLAYVSDALAYPSQCMPVHPHAGRCRGGHLIEPACPHMRRESLVDPRTVLITRCRDIDRPQNASVAVAGVGWTLFDGYRSPCHQCWRSRNDIDQNCQHGCSDALADGRGRTRGRWSDHSSPWAIVRCMVGGRGTVTPNARLNAVVARNFRQTFTQKPKMRLVEVEAPLPFLMAGPLCSRRRASTQAAQLPLIRWPERVTPGQALAPGTFALHRYHGPCA